MEENKLTILQNIFTQNGLTSEDVHIFTKWYQKYTQNMLDRTQMDNIQDRLTQYFDLFKKYGKTPSDFIALFHQKSAIILREVPTINYNIQKNAHLLNLSPDTVLEMGLKQPPFLLGNPHKHKINTDKLSEIFQTNAETIIQIAIKQPQLLYHDTAEINKKYQLYRRCYLNGLFTLNTDTPQDRAIMKKAFHQKDKAILKKYEEKLIQRLLNDPSLLFLGIDNIRLKIGYARFLKAQGQKTTTDSFRKSKKYIQEILEKAPNEFKEKNKPTYHLFSNSTNTKE